MKKITFSILKLVFAFSLLAFMPTEGNSTHLMGSDFTYKCEGAGKFRLILKIYRDCRGVPLGGNASVRIEAPGCGTQTVTAPNTEINDVTPKCATASGPCSPQNQRASKGIEEHVYEVVVDFTKAPYKNWAANGCCKVYFSWQSCCRNGAITTGVGGGFYSYAMLDICNMKGSKDTLCNNSPQLTNPPIAFACCNQPFTYNNGASDNQDFDSLSYEMVAALGNSRTNTLAPSSPLTVKSPMTVYCGFGNTPPCTPIPLAKPPIGFYLDPETGDMIFTPTDCSEVGVVAIQVNEWRKDTNGVYKLIGITRRDIQVWVENCDKNNPPTLLGPYAYSVCEGDKLCFDIKSKDVAVVVPPPGVSQKPDTTQLSWNKGIPGATFKIKDPKVRERVGQFCWEPQIGQASSLPYTFTVTAKDQACPRPAVSIRGYSVTVKKRALGERVYDTFPCGKLVFECNPEDGFQGVPKYLWALKDLSQTQIYYTSGKKKDSFRFKKGGTYIAELVLNNSNSCPTVYLDTIEIPKFIEVELAVGDTFVCEGDSMELIPRIGYANRPITYDWTYATTGQQISTDSAITIFPTRDTTVAVFVTDADKCTNTDTVFIHWQALSRPWLGQDERICTYDTFQIVVPYDSMLSYRWNDGPIGVDTTLTVNVAGQYWLHTIDSLGCFGRDTFELFVNDTVVADAGPDATICAKQFHTLEGGIEQDPSKTHVWNWYDLRNNVLVATDKDNDVSPTDSTYYRLHLMITDGGQMCEDDDTMFLRVNQLPDLSSVRNPSPKCFDEGQFDLGASSPIGAGFSWSEKPNSDVWYTTKDSRRDTMVRNGFSTPNWYYTQRFFDLDKNKGYIPPQDPISERYEDDVFIHVKHQVTGCEDSAEFNVIIAENPTIILQDLVRCQDAGSFRLNPTVVRAPQNPDAGIYTWVIDSAPTGLTNFELDQILEDRDPSFFNDYWFNPMIPGTHPSDAPNVKRLGTYKLKFCYESGVTNCSSCDSVYITVEELPEIVFSPFDKFCYSDDTINLDDYVNLPQGRWELKDFNNITSGAVYDFAKGRMLDSTRINVIDTIADVATLAGRGGTYYWRYVNVTTGCPVQDSVKMDVSPRPQLVVTDLDTICVDAGLVDLAALVTTPNAGTFNAGGPLTGWSGNGVTGSSFDPTSVVTANATDPLYGPFVQTVVYQHPNTLCVNNDSVDVMIQVAPVINITTPLPAEACEGVDFNLTATAERAGAGIAWSTAGDGTFDDNTSLTPIYTPGTQDDTDYGTTLTITSNQPDYLRHCPVATADINLNIHAYPDFDFGNFDSGCTPVTANFQVDPLRRPTNYPVTYLWDFGNGQTSTDSAPQNIVFTGEGTYNVSVTVTNSAGACATTKEDSFIQVFPIPVASFTSNPDYYTTVALPKFQFTNTSTISNGSIDSFLWDFDDLGARYTAPDDISNLENPAFAYADDTMEYRIRFTVVSDKGCIDDTVKNIKIGPDITVFIPTAFSPDGAGPDRNNKLYVSAQGYIGYNLKIFNRWGEKLFESNHPVDEQWDGTYQGEPVQQGVYVYYAEVIAFDGELYKYSGTVTLIR